MQSIGEIIADLLSKSSAAIVAYVAQINPFLSLVVAAGLAILIFFLRRKIRKLWNSGGMSDSSSIADGLGDEQKISNNVQSGLDNFLDSKNR